MKIPDLWPYDIKNRNLFYNRNHDAVPVLKHSDYWDDQIKKAIEGHWVDDDGTWVFMMPKLYWHVNIFVGTITNQYNVRTVGHLELTDREFIIFSYILCCYGFSGFTGDEFYTSHWVVEKVESGVQLNRIEQKILDTTPFLHDKHGKLKKYIEPWHYLTEHYLLKEVQGIPLGLIRYDNPLQDGFIFGARGSSKTYCIASCLAHEFYTGGVNNWDEIHNLGVNPNLFGIGSAKSDKVEGFVEVIKNFHSNMPGGIDRDGVKVQPPLYRRLIGSWGEGHLKHEYRDEDNNIRGSLSRINQGVYTVQNPGLFVGGRYRIIAEDEVGLNPNVQKSQSAEKNSMIDKMSKVYGQKIGLSFRLGTSGFIDYIDGCRDMFYHPSKYGIFGISNVWEKIGQKIGLFLPDYMVRTEYKDSQGNTYIEESYDACMAEVEKLIKDGSSGVQIKEHEMNNPNWPSSMFIDGRTGMLPSDLAKVRKLEIEQMGGTFRLIGNLKRVSPKKVKFEIDPRGEVQDNYEKKTTRAVKNACAIVYEEPIPNAPFGLYKGVYDPIRDDGEGESDDASLCAIIVYKGYDASLQGKQNSIVYRHTFRYGSKDECHEQVVLACDYYGCQVLHEDDVGDFVTYCKNIGRTEILAQTPVLSSNINFKISGNAIFNVGVKINSNPELKSYCIGLYAEWLKTVRVIDNETKGFKNIDEIDDLLILDEIIEFGEGNYDATSAMLVLMLWIRCDSTKVYETRKMESRSANIQELYKVAMRNLNLRKPERV